jgi:hypothetical protein
MALNLGNSGDFANYVKFNAKADKWFVKEGDGEKEVVKPTFIADLENIRTGWFYFKAGQAPQVVLDKNLSEPAANPGLTYTDEKGKVKNCYNRGFKMKLFSQNNFGGVVEWSANSMIINQAVNELYTKYEEGLKSNPGLLPVVSVTGSTPVKSDYGTNYSPKMEIIKWVSRPVELATTAALGAPSAPAANTNPEPAPVQAKASVSEF